MSTLRSLVEKWEEAHPKVLNVTQHIPRPTMTSPFLVSITRSGPKLFMNGRCIGMMRGSRGFGGSFKGDLVAVSKRALEFATSCTVPENSSCAPSMMLHQTAALSLALLFSGSSQWEQKLGTYTPDLLLNGTMPVDICANVTLKNKDLASRGIKDAMLIDKYSFLQDMSHLQDLIHYSKANDDLDMSLFSRLLDKQAAACGKERMYKDDVLNFFSKRRDPLGRNLSVHYEAARGALLDRVLMPVSGAGLPDISVVETHVKCALPPVSFEGLLDRHAYCFHPDWYRAIIVPQDKEHFSEGITGCFADITGAKAQSKKPYFEKRQYAYASQKAVDAILQYPEDKCRRDQGISLYYSMLVKELNNRTEAFKRVFPEEVAKRLRLNSDLSVRSRDKVDALIGVPYESSPALHILSWRLKNPCAMDPDHELMLSSSGSINAVEILRHNRDYHDLRMKARVARAILDNHKPGATMDVSHWSDPELKASVHVEGLILEQDKGIVVVSFCNGSRVYRTEKWHCADIMHYLVADLRLCTLAAESAKIMKRSTLVAAIMIYGRLLHEASWGFSRVLKAYRYFASGVVMGNSLSSTAFQKMVDRLKAEDLQRYSWLLMDNLIKNSKFQWGKSPMFHLDFEHIGFECFIMHCCCSYTYGQMKHTKDTIKELASEILMFDKSYTEVKAIYDDFSDVLVSDDLPKAYARHMSLIDSLAAKTKDRFTGSPLSALLISDRIDNMKIRYNDVQGAMPSLDMLFTSKAAYNGYTGEQTLACNSVGAVVQKYDLSSVSRLCLAILNKEGTIDLTFSMFAKGDQLGDNREISKMSGEFRILQVVCEYFFRAIAKHTKSDRLHDSEKVKKLYTHLEELKEADYRVMYTGDESRWGPNNRTGVFGLMALLFCKHTTEAYIPALCLLLMEYKIFQMPVYISELFELSDAVYSLPGLVGISHMGQGITHQTSSVFHSLETEQLCLEIDLACSKMVGPRCSSRSTAMVTSDDILITNTLKMYDTPTKDRSYICSRHKMVVRAWLLSYAKYVRYYGIKASDYKNVISESSFEFNSIYLSLEGVGSCDLKFLTGLVQPMTTGSMLSDYSRVLDTYYDALSSGCKEATSEIICKSNFIRFCHTWKIRLDAVGFPSRETMVHGLAKKEEDDSKPETSFNTLQSQNTLRYRLKELNIVRPQVKDMLLNERISYVLSLLAVKREANAFRALRPYGTQTELFSDSPMFQAESLLGETFCSFVYHVNRDWSHAVMAMGSRDVPYCYTKTIKIVSKPGLRSVCAKKTLYDDYEPLDVAVSSFPVEACISRDSTDEQILRHILRARHAELDKVVSGRSVMEVYVKAREELLAIQATSSSCHTVVNVRPGETLSVPSLVVIPPESALVPRKTKKINAFASYIPFLYGLYVGSSYSPLFTLGLTEDRYFYVSALRDCREVPRFSTLKASLVTPDFPMLLSASFHGLLELEKKSHPWCYLNIRKVSLPETKSAAQLDVPAVDDLMALLEDESIAEAAKALAFEEEQHEEDDVTEAMASDFMDMMSAESTTYTRSSVSIRLSGFYAVLIDRVYASRAVSSLALVKQMIAASIIYGHTGNADEVFSRPCYCTDKGLAKVLGKMQASCERLLSSRAVSREAVLSLIRERNRMPSSRLLLDLLGNRPDCYSLSLRPEGDLLSEEAIHGIDWEMFIR